MANHPAWQEEYWLLLLRVYLQKPVGIKSCYSPKMVELALNIGLHPQLLHQKMEQLVAHKSRSLEQLWNTFSEDKKALSEAIKQIKKMEGFHYPQAFYHNVAIKETWQKDFSPISKELPYLPIQLIIILELYFRLTPLTISTNTPEVKQLATQLKLTTDDVVDILKTFMLCDPYLNKPKEPNKPLFKHCLLIWQRYGNLEPTVWGQEADALKDYFKTWHKR